MPTTSRRPPLTRMMKRPEGVIWSRKIFEVIPKLPSARLLFQTSGSEPSLVAFPPFLGQPAAVLAQLGGRIVPTAMLAGSLL